jgi:hypothetical protein
MLKLKGPASHAGIGKRAIYHQTGRRSTCLLITFWTTVGSAWRRVTWLISAQVTDAHCHPTDLDIAPEDYDAVKVGGIGAMATVPEDQSKVAALREERGWRAGDLSSAKNTRSRRYGPRVVSCFGKTLSHNLDQS